MAFLAPFFAAASPYIMAGTAALTAYSQYRQGKAAEDAAALQAEQLRRQANDERALAQQEAANKRRELRYMQSRAQAVAAASGAGAADPTVADLMGDLEEVGEYEALGSLWAGESRARQSEYAAKVARYEGKVAKKKARTQALTTIMSSALSMYNKFGAPAGAGGTKGLSMDMRGTSSIDARNMKLLGWS